MKKIIFCLIILISFSTIAYAEEGAGSPGRYAAYADIQPDEFWCAVYYPYPGPWPPLWTIGHGAEPSYIKLVITKNKIHVICHFTDVSTQYEADAEVADIVDAILSFGGLNYCGGTGQVIAAANHGDDPGGIGGNVTLKCTFDNVPSEEPCPSTPPDGDGWYPPQP